ncbi:hypothetical protein SAMN05216283_102313 [Sunxiuqinia elliptica]|uniref:Uncharacterized protein n=1 Tax=Sunxiuqinia elliptica TaxID=655355 RepID=A0A1I2F069_9BACT|nr:hypothetical protein SAMN05216283_102313 [Sunxiuqinia elliptica]
MGDILGDSYFLLYLILVFLFYSADIVITLFCCLFCRVLDKWSSKLWVQVAPPKRGR